MVGKVLATVYAPTGEVESRLDFDRISTAYIRTSENRWRTSIGKNPRYTIWGIMTDEVMDAKDWLFFDPDNADIII